MGMNLGSQEYFLHLSNDYIYEFKALTVGQVLDHFNSLDKTFLSDLQNRVTLESYALKLCHQAQFFCMQDQELLVGVIAFYSGLENGTCYISHLGISETEVGKGLGLDLLGRFVDTLSGSGGIKKIRLEVTRTNDSAVVIYNKFGFEVTASSAGRLEMTKRLESQT